MPGDRELRTDGRYEKYVMFCTENQRGKKCRARCRWEGAERDIKNVLSMNGSV
jgi:hypothetical protein